MASLPALGIALRLWPQARDHGAVDDPAQLDVLIDAQGLPGAPGYDCGLRHTFACFTPDAPATLTLPTGERPDSDEEARFIGHLLVTRTLLAVGLGIDERVNRALAEAHALSWVTEGGAPYHQTPLVLALSLWLVVLDPHSDGDRPLLIDWSAACYDQRDWWDRDQRLYSHYDVRERALDWAAYASYDVARRGGVSLYTIAEPLLRVGADVRVRLALGHLAAAVDTGERAPAAALLERSRIAALLQGYLATAGGPSAGAGPRVEL